MHANAIANGVVVSFPSKMLTHRKIAPAAIKPKLAMMKSLFSIFFISFSPSDFSAFYRARSKYSRLSRFRLSIITGHAQAAVTLPPNCCSRPHPPWGSRPCPGSRRRLQGPFWKRTGGWGTVCRKTVSWLPPCGSPARSRQSNFSWYFSHFACLILVGVPSET